MAGLEVWDVVKIAAGSGVVAAMINQGVQWLKDRSRQKGEAQYCAITIIAKLEQFAIACSRSAEYHGRVINESPYFDDFSKLCNLPELTWSEDRLDVLQSPVGARLVWLSTEIQLAHGKASDNFENEVDHEGYAMDRVSIVGYFGYEALLLAERLRREYSLPALISNWGLDQNKTELERLWERAKERLK
ncbi:hypothetical protein [Pseudomonas viridiflava]|uniref:hypothetical protein n=2 Tax=Pseudomonas viridiflava TaxID=33069 RepID=UPI000F0156E7|nr:hypothetical protein [Pseudomonas viridiflava]